MEYALAAAHRSLERVRVAHVPDSGLDLQIAEIAEIRSRPNESADLVASIKECPRDVGADEPRRPGDQRSHCIFLQKRKRVEPQVRRAVDPYGTRRSGWRAVGAAGLEPAASRM